MFKDYKLEILFQDDYIVAINKPSGLLVHRSMIDPSEIYFAVNILRDQIGKYVYPVHRIDKPTSGVLLFALDSQSAKILSEQFLANQIEKRYLAVVRGYTQPQGVIDYPLSRKLDKIADCDASQNKEPQEAISTYTRLATVEVPYEVGKYAQTRYSLVEVVPKTGRKHQIRRHMKHLSHHLVGDTKYGRGEHNKFIREQYDCHRMLLHSYSLSIFHPYDNNRLTFKAPLDESFKSIFTSFGWEELMQTIGLN
ncbi:tRNA pseudouridine(65) synthase TruC [Arcobacter sp. FWKO B]|uniref:tRNA pseudouridine(65) synthase TruC n=1 Tax=Arcobacter sp. FWKO B TaxID=2593672 RepID=UPI0018A646FA|nr:tRNA pseudouridine(65) synthase TruC [Arcobacter sp. FWKO B]QOG12429.1 tRNA pseudouridine(65) synthase TruC [Arcobacter sp. FWKO B]